MSDREDMSDSVLRKQRLEHALRRHHGIQKKKALVDKILRYGGDPNLLTWLSFEETDQVLELYVAKYGTPVKGHAVLRIPANIDMHSRWNDLRSVAPESIGLTGVASSREVFIFFNERWYLGVAKAHLAQLAANLIPFALADGEVVAAYSLDMVSGLILDVIVGEEDRKEGEMFMWGPDFFC